MLSRPPRSYASVDPPTLSDSGRTSTRLKVERRLARNLAVLTGVAVDDHPSGRTWVARYGDLTVAEISRGWPRAITSEVDKAEPEPTGLDVIANASLHRYGPETKAALVLAGADELFRTVEQTMVDVLSVVCTSDDGLPLADAMRVTAWASLIADLYQAQPALFVAAVQARAVQRSATAEWWPAVRSEPQRKVEFPPMPAAYDHETHPSQLGVLDRVMREHVAPRSPVAAGSFESEGGGPSDAFLVESLVDRWLRHLLYSADGGVAWVAEDSRGSYVDAFQPHLAALSSFAADAQGQYFKVVPFVLGDNNVTEPEAFAKSNPSHTRRLVPRTPSLPEFAKLPRDSQEALARTSVQMLRVLRDSSSFVGGPMLEQTLPALEAWASLTRNVLGADNLTTRWVELVRARLALNHYRLQADPASLETMQNSLLTAFAAMRDMAVEGAICQGDWVELVYDCGAPLNAMWQDLQLAGRAKESQAVLSQLRGDWATALAVVGIDATQPSLHPISVQPGLAGLLHNYVGFQVKLDDVGARLAALTLGRSQLLPARQQVADVRGTDTALRTSLQVLLRGASLTLPMVTSEGDREALLSDIRSYSNKLRHTQMVEGLMADGEHPDRTGHVNCLGALALGLVVLVEMEEPVELDYLQRCLNKAVAAAMRASKVTRVADLSVQAERIAELMDTVRRFRLLTGREVRVNL